MASASYRRRTTWRTVHCPTCPIGIRRNLPDSAGFRRTSHPDFFSVTRAKLACLVQRESGGVRRNMAYSGGLHGIPPYFFHWSSPPDSIKLCRVQRNPPDRVQQNLPDRVQRNPLESTGQSPTESTGQSPTESTGQSPTESTGLLTN
jgi:hypothetical protein